MVHVEDFFFSFFFRLLLFVVNVFVLLFLFSFFLSSFLSLGILTEKGFEKAKYFEHSGMLLLVLFTLGIFYSSLSLN